MILYVCFFKQKTAYVMRISDCSSDVCSSDLEKFIVCISDGPVDAGPNIISSVGGMITSSALKNNSTTKRSGSTITPSWPGGKMPQFVLWPGKRSEERRVGKACVSKCRYRLSTCH